MGMPIACSLVYRRARRFLRNHRTFFGHAFSVLGSDIAERVCDNTTEDRGGVEIAPLTNSTGGWLLLLVDLNSHELGTSVPLRSHPPHQMQVCVAGAGTPCRLAEEVRHCTAHFCCGTKRATSPVPPLPSMGARVPRSCRRRSDARRNVRKSRSDCLPAQRSRLLPRSGRASRPRACFHFGNSLLPLVVSPGYPQPPKIGAVRSGAPIAEPAG